MHKGWLREQPRQNGRPLHGDLQKGERSDRDVSPGEPYIDR